MFLVALGNLVGGASLIVNPIPSDSGKIRLTGLTWNQVLTTYPNFASYVVSLEEAIGSGLLVFGILAVVLIIVPFRKGQKWAWYAAWTIPLYVVLDINYAMKLGYWPVTSVELLLSLVGLLLPYRKFFPKDQKGQSRI